MRLQIRVLIVILALITLLLNCKRVAAEECERKLPDGTEVLIDSPSCEAQRESQEEEKRVAAEEAKQKELRAEYLAKRMRELSSYKGLISVEPGTQLCKFPMTDNSFLLVEDVGKDKLHTVTEYSRSLLKPQYKIVLRKHPKFKGKIEIEILGSDLSLVDDLAKLREHRIASGKCSR